MKFSVAAVVAVLAAIAEAKPAFTNLAFNVVPGQPFELSWNNANGPVEIVLNKEITAPGSSNPKFDPDRTLGSGLTGTTFTFTLDASTLSSGLYAFSIKDTNDPDYNYSEPFSLQGSSSSSSRSTSATTSATTTSATTTTTDTTTSAPSTTTSGNRSSSSSSSSRTIATTTGPTPTPSNLNAGGKVQSSLALVFVGFAAFAFLN